MKKVILILCLIAAGAALCAAVLPQSTVPEETPAANVDAFIEKVKRYTEINEFTPELLRLFIQRIEVGEHAVKHSCGGMQSVRIIYRDSGTTDSAMTAAEQQPHFAEAITDKEEIIRLLA